MQNRWPIGHSFVQRSKQNKDFFLRLVYSYSAGLKHQSWSLVLLDLVCVFAVSLYLYSSRAIIYDNFHKCQVNHAGLEVFKLKSPVIFNLCHGRQELPSQLTFTFIVRPYHRLADIYSRVQWFSTFMRPWPTADTRKMLLANSPFKWRIGFKKDLFNPVFVKRQANVFKQALTKMDDHTKLIEKTHHCNRMIYRDSV